jgi:hypothetical protein
MSSTYARGQLTLPGQAAAPDGPVDLAPIFLMDHALRRDLTAFAAAVRATPVADRRTWRALDLRWRRFAEILHLHHSGEDEFIWPALTVAVDVGGTHEDRATLEAMKAEHAEIDPMLGACARGFAALARQPDEALRTALVDDLTATRNRLGAHLGHEERDALALVQRFLSAADWVRMDKQIGSTYPPRLIPFTLAWVLHGLPEEGRGPATAFFGRPVPTLWSLVLRRGFERRERATFRYAEAPVG